MDVDIVNVSLSFADSQYTGRVEGVCAELMSRGVIVVAAGSPHFKSYPACIPGIVSVVEERSSDFFLASSKSGIYRLCGNRSSSQLAANVSGLLSVWLSGSAGMDSKDGIDNVLRVLQNTYESLEEAKAGITSM
jgi:hypothetical protein